MKLIKEKNKIRLSSRFINIELCKFFNPKCIGIALYFTFDFHAGIELDLLFITLKIYFINTKKIGDFK
jgi:hypothetical protein